LIHFYFYFFAGRFYFLSSNLTRGLKGGEIIKDHDLIQWILKGQTEYYKDLIHRYQKLVYYSILKIVDGDQEEAKDLMQDAFIAAYRSLKYFRNDSSFSTWLVKIAINRTLDFKKRKRPQTISEDQILQQITVPEDGPLDHVLKKEARNLMKERLNQLPLLYQQVIHDYYFNQLSYQEIALKEGVKVKTIESRLYRARSMLKHSWKEASGHEM
jgi:RNA polymerase sigma factor (sigma-70 family)